MKNLLIKFWSDESGATAIEYGLTCGLLAIVIITAATTLGTKISADFSKVSANM